MVIIDRYYVRRTPELRKSRPTDFREKMKKTQNSRSLYNTRCVTYRTHRLIIQRQYMKRYSRIRRIHKHTNIRPPPPMLYNSVHIFTNIYDERPRALLYYIATTIQIIL